MIAINVLTLVAVVRGPRRLAVRRYVRLVLGTFIFVGWTASAQSQFGFARGTTMEKVIGLVGESSVEARGFVQGIPYSNLDDVSPPESMEELASTFSFNGSRLRSLHPLAPEDIKKISWLLLRRAPNEAIPFTKYFLEFVGSSGLMRIVAIAQPKETLVDADGLQNFFDEVRESLTRSDSRSDLRPNPSMKTETAFDVVWRIPSWRAKVSAGKDSFHQTWDWQCRYNARFIKEFNQEHKGKISVPEDSRIACGTPSATNYPLSFYRGNRVASMELVAEFTKSHEARIRLDYRYDEFDHAMQEIAYRAEHED